MERSDGHCSINVRNPIPVSVSCQLGDGIAQCQRGCNIFRIWVETLESGRPTTTIIIPDP